MINIIICLLLFVYYIFPLYRRNERTPNLANIGLLI